MFFSVNSLAFEYREIERNKLLRLPIEQVLALAHQGNIDAQNWAANHHYSGGGNRYCFWASQAMEGGHAEAIWKYAFNWKSNLSYCKDSDVNKKSKIYWLTLAAKQDFAPAQFSLYYAYLKDDENTALRWLSMAADLEYPDAMTELAMFYAKGIYGYKQNIKEAADLYEKALSKQEGENSFDTAFYLGEIYLGEKYDWGGVDVDKALGFFKICAAPGFSHCYGMINVVLTDSKYGNQNSEEAYFWAKESLTVANRPSAQVFAHLDISDILISQRNYPLAIEHLDQVIAIAKSDSFDAKMNGVSWTQQVGIRQELIESMKNLDNSLSRN